MSWIALRIVPANNSETVISALFDQGSQGVHEDGDAVVTHVPPETDIEAVKAAVLAADPAARIEESETPKVSWDEWKANVNAHTLGNLTVCPPWLADQFDPSQTIVIDPEMAFGTGEHPTTRGVVRLMQKFVQPGDVVADLGAGSAVLAIAAAKLGASRVVAIELDSDASGNAEENIDRNGVREVVQYIEGDAGVLLPLLAPVDIVLANIISSVLIDLLPVIKRSLASDGKAILSGILIDEEPQMMTALTSQGWRVVDEDREGEWWTVAVAQSE